MINCIVQLFIFLLFSNFNFSVTIIHNNRITLLYFIVVVFSDYYNKQPNRSLTLTDPNQIQTFMIMISWECFPKFSLHTRRCKKTHKTLFFFSALRYTSLWIKASAKWNCKFCDLHFMKIGLWKANVNYTIWPIKKIMLFF